MKIIVTSPLFAPEIAEPAPYVKTISKQLGQDQEVIVLTYSNIQNLDNNKNLIAIKKNQASILRIFQYLLKLLKITKKNDIIYAQSGLSTSLASLISAKLKGAKIIYRYSEDEAYLRYKKNIDQQTSSEEFLKKNNLPFKIKSLKKIQNIIFKKVDLLISTNTNLLDQLKNHYEITEKKIRLIYNPSPKKIVLPFASKSNSIIINGKNLDKDALVKILDECLGLETILKDLKIIALGYDLSEAYKNKQNISFPQATSLDHKYFISSSSILHLFLSQKELMPKILVHTKETEKNHIKELKKIFDEQKHK